MPRAKAPQVAQNEPQASNEAAVDPGPPPSMPEAPQVVSYAIAQMHTVASQHQARVMDRQSARENLAGISVFREPPPVAHYKAEILSWLDALDAYEATLG